MKSVIEKTILILVVLGLFFAVTYIITEYYLTPETYYYIGLFVVGGGVTVGFALVIKLIIKIIQDL